MIVITDCVADRKQRTRDGAGQTTAVRCPEINIISANYSRWWWDVVEALYGGDAREDIAGVSEQRDTVWGVLHCRFRVWWGRIEETGVPS